MRILELSRSKLLCHELSFTVPEPTALKLIAEYGVNSAHLILSGGQPGLWKKEEILALG